MAQRASDMEQQRHPTVHCIRQLRIVNFISQEFQRFKHNLVLFVNYLHVRLPLCWRPTVTYVKCLISIQCLFNSQSFALAQLTGKPECSIPQSVSRAEEQMQQLKLLWNVCQNTICNGECINSSLELLGLFLGAPSEVKSEQRADNPPSGGEAKQPQRIRRYLSPLGIYGIGQVVLSWVGDFFIG